jgi:CheY-like chemotaxis protein
VKKQDIRILLVDDEVSLIEAIEKLLTGQGYQVSTASSGQEAIELCRRESFNIVFLDVNMPELNGLETYKRLKEHMPEAPVVMITGYGRSLKHLIEEARQLGVKACIDKPFRIKQITDCIMTYAPHED